MRGRKIYVMLNVIIPLIACAVIGFVCCSILFTETVVKHTIKFTDGDTLHATIESSGSEEILLPAAPTRACATFEGWYYDNNTWQEAFDPMAFIEAPIAEDIVVYAKWSELEHTPSKWVVSNEATCTSTGLRSISCTVCEILLDTEVIDKTPHKASAAVVEKSVAASCISTGSYYDVVYCSNCKYKMSETKKIRDIDPSAHCFDLSYENNRISPMIEGSYDSFCFEGVCKLCSMEIFEKNITVDVSYKYDCLTDGKATYKYVRCGKTFTYEVVLPKQEHFLNGLPASYWAETRVVGGEEVLCYSNRISGVKISGTAAYTCGDISDGVFVCDFCKAGVKVKLFHDHEGTWKTTVAPTCTKEGQMTIDCKVCKSTVKESIPCHNFKYKATDAKVIHSLGSGRDYTVYNLNGECLNCNTTDVIKHVTYKFDVAPTCLDYGVIGYTAAALPGQKFSVTAALTTHFVHNDSLGVDVAASTLENKDGSYNSSYSFIKYFAGSERVCGKTVNGYYDCLKCEQRVAVSVFNVHNGEWEDSTMAPPSCLDYSQQLKRCTDCGEVQYRTIAPLGHSYEYELISVGSDLKSFNVRKSCNRDGCTLESSYPLKAETVTAKVKTVSKVAPTCGTSGLYVYNYTYVDTENGGTTYDLSLEISVPPTEKHMLDKNVSAASKQNAEGQINVNTGYIRYFAGQKILCGEVKMAYYVCYDCDQLVYVEAYKEHRGTWKTEKEPTCYSVGKRVMTCSDCGKVEGEIPTTAHTYSCTIEKTGSVLYTRYIKCSVEKCGYSLPEEKVVPKVDKVYAPTCMEEGKTIYKYTETIDGVTLTATYETDYVSKTDHTLCGKYASTHLTEDGYLLSSQKGVDISDDVDMSKVENGDIVHGGFTCEKCGRYITDYDIKIVK